MGSDLDGVAKLVVAKDDERLERERQEAFVDNLMPEIIRHASEYGMAKVSGYLLAMAIGFCGEAGYGEFQILEAVIEAINVKRCIICGEFQTHLHGGKQYP